MYGKQKTQVLGLILLIHSVAMLEQRHVSNIVIANLFQQNAIIGASSDIFCKVTFASVLNILWFGTDQGIKSQHQYKEWTWYWFRWTLGGCSRENPQQMSFRSMDWYVLKVSLQLLGRDLFGMAWKPDGCFSSVECLSHPVDVHGNVGVNSW